MLIRLEAVSKSYRVGPVSTEVLRGVPMTARITAAFVVIVTLLAALPGSV